MKIHRNLVTPAKPIVFDEDIDFSSRDYGSSYPLLGLEEVHASGEFYLSDEGLRCAAKVHCVATLSDARTCEPFDQRFDFEDDCGLPTSPEEDAEGYLFEGNVIELDELIYCLIHTQLPMCPRKGGSPLPRSGEGYTVYSEDDLMEEEKSSPFDALKDYQFEE